MRDVNIWCAVNRLVDHAVALGQPKQIRELLLRRIRLKVKVKPDFPEADRGLLGDAKRSPEIQVTFSLNGRAD